MVKKSLFPRMLTNLGVRTDDPEDLRLKKNLLVASSLLTLLLPFFLAMTLGGFINSSAVLLWFLTCPIGAFLFTESRESVAWFAAYMVLLVASGFIEPVVEKTARLPDGIITAFFVMNLAAVSTVTFMLLQYFVRQKDRAFRLLHAEREKSERLLYNVLPREIAPALKEGGKRIAERLARMALEMRDYVKSRPSFKGNQIRFRIGIKSGVVVAGVVGLQKFHYDVWGDDVNFASRMESQGVVGKIQISRSTYTLIRDNFRCRLRGTVTVKGKGARESRLAARLLLPRCRSTSRSSGNAGLPRSPCARWNLSHRWRAQMTPESYRSPQKRCGHRFRSGTRAE